ncbi:MAG: ATP-dependent sacrificial sulfur transferase LarE [Thermodesulfovibrionales bacterium]
MSIYDRLLKRIKDYDNSVIAYSGGVDSSLLVLLSHLSGIRFLPITIISEVITKEDTEEAKNLTKGIGVHHHLEYVSLLSHENFRLNPRDRCFYCKEIIMKRLRVISQNMDFRYILEGSNHDDLGDWRPGLNAIKLFDEVKSPFIELSIKKSDIRDILRQIGFSNWDKPSSTCLATRVYYDTEITEPLLQKIRDSEAILRKRGFNDVRVRTNGTTALIEVNKGQNHLILNTPLGEEIKSEISSFGFTSVEIAEEGYISGRLNQKI